MSKKITGIVPIDGILNIGAGIINLVHDLMPTKSERRIRRAIRRLKGREKNVSIANYVMVNFPDHPDEQKVNLIEYLKAMTGRKE